MTKRKQQPSIHTRLETVCKTLERVNSTVIVCCMALRDQDAEHDREIGNVLREHGSNPLFATMLELSLITTLVRGKRAI